MAILTPLSLERAQELGRLYGLAVTSVEGIPAGSVNSNYCLHTKAGRVFCRLYEEQTAETASREALLLAHLAEQDVPTPQPLRRHDGEGFIATAAGRPVALFPWRDGDTRCQRSITPAVAHAVGAALARVHLAGEGFDERAAAAGAPPLGPSRFGPEALAERLGRLPSERSPDVDLVARRARSWIDAHALELEPPGAPRGLIHGDLFRDNVLWQADTISALLDFESASLGSRAFDVMVVVLSWCFSDHLDPDLASAVFRGYRSERALSDDELDELHRMGCFVAVRFSVTRITDFELRPAGTGVYKDYRRFVARWDALERLGEGGLRRLAELRAPA